MYSAVPLLAGASSKTVSPRSPVRRISSRWTTSLSSTRIGKPARFIMSCPRAAFEEFVRASRLLMNASRSSSGFAVSRMAKSHCRKPISARKSCPDGSTGIKTAFDTKTALRSISPSFSPGSRGGQSISTTSYGSTAKAAFKKLRTLVVCKPRTSYGDPAFAPVLRHEKALDWLPSASTINVR